MRKERRQWRRRTEVRRGAARCDGHTGMCGEVRGGAAEAQGGAVVQEGVARRDGGAGRGDKAGGGLMRFWACLRVI